MKRIKYEDIQTSIQNYIKQRNLKSTLIEPNSTETRSQTTIKTKNLSPNQLLFKTQLNSNSDIATDLNLMALNDLVLIESSINDYYSLSFDSTTDQEYLKQFKM